MPGYESSDSYQQYGYSDRDGKSRQQSRRSDGGGDSGQQRRPRDGGNNSNQQHWPGDGGSNSYPLDRPGGKLVESKRMVFDPTKVASRALVERGRHKDKVDNQDGVLDGKGEARDLANYRDPLSQQRQDMDRVRRDTDRVRTRPNTNPHSERQISNEEQRGEAAFTESDFVPRNASRHRRRKDYKAGLKDHKRGLKDDEEGLRKFAARKIGKTAGGLTVGAVAGIAGGPFWGPFWGMAGHHYGEKIGEEIGEEIGEMLEEFDAEKFGKKIMRKVWGQLDNGGSSDRTEGTIPEQYSGTASRRKRRDR